MIIVSKEEGAKWPNLGSLTELRGFYGIYEKLLFRIRISVLDAL